MRRGGLLSFFIHLFTNFFLLPFAFFLLPASLPAQWHILNPFPTSQTINDLVFIDALHGIAVGNSGTILETWDGGENWALTDKQIPVSLNDICLVGNNKLLFCGASGSIYTSDVDLSSLSLFDAGDETLVKFCFVNDVKGFCAGDDGLLLSTSDGGASWSRAIINPSYDFTDIEFPDSQTGYLSAFNQDTTNLGGALLKSTDGGLSWNLCLLDYNQIFAISFPSRDIGFMACPGGGLYSTRNGGDSWTRTDLWNTVVTEVFFSNINIGYCLLAYGSLFRSTDGGGTWSPISQIGSTKGLTRTGKGYYAWGFGGDIWYSEKGDETWTRQVRGYRGQLSKIIFADDDHGIIFGDTVKYVTSDGGETWKQEPFNLRTVYEGDFGSVNNGFVEASGGFYYTKDGGATWHQASGLHSLRANFDAAFANENRVFETGINYSHFFADPMVFRSDDGGANWVEIDPFGNRLIRDIEFPTRQRGYAVGENRIFTTNNGGDDWEESFVAEFATFENASFCDANHGMVAGYFSGVNGGRYNRILKTSDGGDSWTEVYSDTVMFAPSLGSICMPDRETAYVISGDGRILETHDGGDSWSTGASTTWLTDIAGHNEVFAIGYYGTMLSTSAKARISNGFTEFPLDRILIEAWPNPFTDLLQVQFTLDSTREVVIHLLDLKGSIMQTHTVSGHPGINHIEIEGQPLTPGNYLLTIHHDKYAGAIKIVKFN